MRGRTNILPRVGGYVTGDSIECEVAETNGIQLGDYVQFYQSNVEPSDVKLIGMGSKVKLKNVYGWASIRMDNNGTNLLVKEMIYTQNGELSSRDISFSLPVTSQGFYGNTIFDVGNDVYVVLQYLYTSNGGVIIGFILTRASDGEWSLRQMSQDFSDEVGYFSTNASQYNAKQECCYVAPKIGNKYIFDGKSGNNYYLYVAEWDETNETLSLVKTQFALSGSFSVGDVRVKLLVYDQATGCFVIRWGSTYYCCSVNQNNIVAVVNSVVDSSSIYQAVCLPTKVNGKYVAFGRGGTNSNFLTYCYVYISAQEGVSFGDRVSTTQLLLTSYQWFVGQYQSGKCVIVYYKEDRTGNKSPYTYAQYIYATTAVYDNDLDVVSVGTFELIENISYMSSSDYSETIYLYDLTEQNKFVVSFDFYSSYSTPYDKGGSKILQIVSDAIQVVQNKLLVKKYQNIVSGVAKTSGNLGDTIQVYIPPAPTNS